MTKTPHHNDLRGAPIAARLIAEVKEADKTKLSRAYTFWILAKKNRPHNADPANQADTYENDLKAVATFNTVEDFWANY